MLDEIVLNILENPAVQRAIVGIGRSVLGWIENMFEEGKYQKFSVKLFLSTVVRVGLLDYILGLLGAPMGTAIAVDYGFNAVKKAGSKK